MQHGVAEMPQRRQSGQGECPLGQGPKSATLTSKCRRNAAFSACWSGWSGWSGSINPCTREDLRRTRQLNLFLENFLSRWRVTTLTTPLFIQTLRRYPPGHRYRGQPSGSPCSANRVFAGHDSVPASDVANPLGPVAFGAICTVRLAAGPVAGPSTRPRARRGSKVVGAGLSGCGLPNNKV